MLRLTKDFVHQIVAHWAPSGQMRAAFTCREEATGTLTAAPLGGAANPGCSRLSAGSLHLRTRRFLPPETFPKGPSIARVNASWKL
jgi:hypothetical protein